MHRTMMDRRDDAPGFLRRFGTAFRTNSYDPEDVAVIFAAVAASMMLGGVIGWVLVEAITTLVTTTICASVCEVAL